MNKQYDVKLQSGLSQQEAGLLAEAIVRSIAGDNFIEPPESQRGLTPQELQEIDANRWRYWHAKQKEDKNEN